MGFQKILAQYRAISFSEKDKGARFERLMQAFLRTVPWYEGKFKHVWLWNEFPYRQHISGKDTGIDLVAQTVEGDFGAVECKCWDENAYTDKSAVDSFPATNGCPNDTEENALVLRGFNPACADLAFPNTICYTGKKGLL